MKRYVPFVQSRVADGRQVELPFSTITAQCYRQQDPRHVGYGQVMLDIWDSIKSPAGMVWIEGDVAIEPQHLRELADDIAEFPESVVAVPFRLHPGYCGLTEAKWPFNEKLIGEGWRQYAASEPVPRHPHSFGLGCTYLPFVLMEAARDRLPIWDWPSLDWKLSLVAWENGIGVTATATPAVHLHYQW